MLARAWIVWVDELNHVLPQRFPSSVKTPRITANDTAKTADSTTATDPAMMNALIMLASLKVPAPRSNGVAGLASHRTHSASVAWPSIGRGLDVVGSQSSLVPPSYASGEDPFLGPRATRRPLEAFCGATFSPLSVLRTACGQPVVPQTTPYPPDFYRDGGGPLSTACPSRISPPRQISTSGRLDDDEKEGQRNAENHCLTACFGRASG